VDTDVAGKVLLRSSVGGYFFDAVFHEDYVHTNEITRHPVLSGAAVSDHVYHQPVEISFDVGMSDCMQSFVAGQFDKLPSRAATAFAIFYGLYLTALPLQVNANIDGYIISYKDMVIKSISRINDRTTHTGTRMTIKLQQVIRTTATTIGLSVVTSSTGSDGKSSDPQVTDQTVGGKVSPFTSDTVTEFYDKVNSGYGALTGN
jgi:hypothetical protein